MPDAISVFILPPSLEVLKERLTRRGSETEEESHLRLKAALGMIRAAPEFDYVVLNDDLDEATHTLEAVLVAERCRVSRQAELIREFTAPEGRAEKGNDT